MYSLDVIHERQHQVPQRLLNITPSMVCKGLKGLLMSSQLDTPLSTPFSLSPEPWLSTCSFQQAILFSLGQQHPKPPEKTAHLSTLRIFGQSRTTFLNSISFCTDRHSILFSHQFFLCTSTGCIGFSFKNKNFLASSSDFSLGSGVLSLSTTKSSFFWLYCCHTTKWVPLFSSDTREITAMPIYALFREWIIHFLVSNFFILSFMWAIWFLQPLEKQLYSESDSLGLLLSHSSYEVLHKAVCLPTNLY